MSALLGLVERRSLFVLFSSVCEPYTSPYFVLAGWCFVMSGVLPKTTGAILAAKAFAKGRTALAKRVPKPAMIGNDATDRERADTRD